MASNFDFLQDSVLAHLASQAKEAEKSALARPRTAAFYSRFVLEQLVTWIYANDPDITPCYGSLNDKIRHTSFREQFQQAILDKMKLIIVCGNKAAHEKRDIDQESAYQAVKELHHILFKVIYLYSESEIRDVIFSAALVPQNLPDPDLTQAQMQALEDKLTQQAEEILQKTNALAAVQSQLQSKQKELAALSEQKAQEQAEVATQLAEKQAAHEAEVAALKEKLKEQVAIHAAKVIELSGYREQNEARTDPHDYDEGETRKRLINLQLEEAGWKVGDVSMVSEEYKVSGMPGASGTGRIDYVLWSKSKKPLAVVEAKRSSKDPLDGAKQASLYADCLEASEGVRPTIFLTNGFEIYIVDDFKGYLWDTDKSGFVKRQVSTFYTQHQLSQLHHRRTHQTALREQEIDANIAGRPYQQEGIRRVTERFENKYRRALMVMPTGSGKTRTAIALTRLLQQCNWADRILFLADRNALLTQAKKAFKEHMPNLSVADLTKLKKTEEVHAQLLLSTYPTMMNWLEKGLFRSAEFDLIIIDEVHRSIFQKYGSIFRYYDALLLGLTATPRAETDRNTYDMFEIKEADGPTFAYEFEDAVEGGYLVPPKRIDVPTKFMSQGITYNNLSDTEKAEYEEQFRDEGEDEPPAHIDADALNSWLFNIDTVDKALAYLMKHSIKVEGGDRIGKTIIFARNIKHAKFILERFEKSYQKQGADFAQLIHSQVSYAQSILDKFSEVDSYPHIAVSVDMLDTGIDVPEVVNLVFFKPVRSRIKFYQMIGRGTRLSPHLFGPEKHKTSFLCFDLCGNFEFFEKDDAEVVEPKLPPSLTHRIMKAQLELAYSLDKDAHSILRKELLDRVHQRVEQMNQNNFLVRPHLRLLQTYAKRESWENLSEEKRKELCQALGDLPSELPEDDYHARRFDLYVLQAQQALLGNPKKLKRLQKGLQEISFKLSKKMTVPAVNEQKDYIASMEKDEFWESMTHEVLEEVRENLRGLQKFIERGTERSVITDFEDEFLIDPDMAVAEDPASYTPVGVGQYKRRVTEFILENQSHTSIAKIRMNKQITTKDLQALEQLLFEAGGKGGDLETFQRAFEDEEPQKLGIFIRKIVGLDEAAVREAFSSLLKDSTYSANQIHFINQIVSHLTKNGVISPKLLFQPPFTDSNPNGVAGMFEQDDAKKIVEIVKYINHNAEELKAAG